MKYKLLVICTIGSSTVRVIKLLIILVLDQREKRDNYGIRLYICYIFRANILQYIWLHLDNACLFL